MTYEPQMNCRKSSLIITFMLMLQVAVAQTNSIKTNYDFSSVDIWLKDNLKDLGGRAVLVVYKDGKIVYSKVENNITMGQKAAAKFIARRQGKDVNEATKYFSITTKERIASCSKWLSAALVMTFVDEGSIRLEDTVGKFLPVLSANGKGNISFWQCLSHLTGIKPGSLKENIEKMKDVQTMNEAISLIAGQSMEGEPGKIFHYSSDGLQIAAAILEKVSGKTFNQLFLERIAKPCDMKNTDFGPGKVSVPAGSGWSTPEDYTNFLTMILNNGIYNGKKVLSEKAVAEMQKNRISADCNMASSPAEAGDWGYGFGEWVMDNPDKLPATKPGIPQSERSNAVTSPGLFGSFPWIDRKLNYAAFLFAFNINKKGRHGRYTGIKQLVDKSITN